MKVLLLFVSAHKIKSLSMKTTTTKKPVITCFAFVLCAMKKEKNSAPKMSR